MKYREHRGFLDDSLKTVVELEDNIQALSQHLNIPVSELEIIPYGFDKRINWDTYLVKTKDGVLGMVDTKISVA